MTSKIYKVIHILLVTATIGLSVLLFVACLFFPSYQLSNGGSFDGSATLLVGWSGFFILGDEAGPSIGFLGWYANLFFLPIWFGLVLSLKFRVVAFIGLLFTLIGIALAACAVLVKNLPVNEAGGTEDVTSMGAGFYIWLASFVICVFGYFAVGIWSMLKSRIVVTN